MPEFPNHGCCVPGPGRLLGMRRGSSSSLLLLPPASSSSSRKLLLPAFFSWGGSSWALTFSDKPSPFMKTLQNKSLQSIISSRFRVATSAPAALMVCPPHLWLWLHLRDWKQEELLIPVGDVFLHRPVKRVQMVGVHVILHVHGQVGHLLRAAVLQTHRKQTPSHRRYLQLESDVSISERRLFRVSVTFVTRGLMFNTTRVHMSAGRERNRKTTFLSISAPIIKIEETDRGAVPTHCTTTHNIFTRFLLQKYLLFSCFSLF